VGKIIEVEDFPQARKPSLKLRIDFGDDIGVKRSCAQLTQNYTKDELDGRLVLGVVNIPRRQIGPAVSEVLILGVPDEEGECVLVAPDRDVATGGELY
jgi:tRNA-binding protein